MRACVCVCMYACVCFYVGLHDCVYVLAHAHGCLGNQSFYTHNTLHQNTFSRDQERAQVLKLQNELDIVQMRRQKEKQELTRQLKTLSEENEDIRKAFKKLLE